MPDLTCYHCGRSDPLMVAMPACPACGRHLPTREEVRRLVEAARQADAGGRPMRIQGSESPGRDYVAVPLELWRAVQAALAPFAPPSKGDAR